MEGLHAYPMGNLDPAGGGVTCLLALRHPHTFPEEYVPITIGNRGAV